MEGFVAVLLFGFVFFLFVQGREKPAKRPSRIQSQEKPYRRRKVFDEHHATVITPPTVLNGPAYVVDGDTIVVRKTQIRLFGVDAPEMNHPYGRRAKSSLMALCRGQSIRAEIVEMDTHGRTVARCYLSDGRDVSAEMVKLGMAIDWPKFSGGKYGNLETPDARKKLWLADARQKGRMHVWAAYEARQRDRQSQID